MASQPDKAAGQLDMTELLDLLNESEALSGSAQPDATIEQPRRDEEGILEPKNFVGETEREVADRLKAGTADPVQTGPGTASAIEADVENRFAAHVIHGMAKLKRRQ